MKTASLKAISVTELLVVMTILTLVLLLGYPAWLKARQASRVSENITNLKQIGLAYLAYGGDHLGRTPEAKRHGTGVRGPWFGTANAWGAPARQLFEQRNPKWGANAEGTHDYLQSPDPLYSPFHQPTARRNKGTFASNGSYGYSFMYSPVEQPLIAGFFNDHIRHGARMPICSDVFGPLYEAGQFSSDRCAVLYLDGGVVIYPQQELLSSRRGYDARFRFLLQR